MHHHYCPNWLRCLLLGWLFCNQATIEVLAQDSAKIAALLQPFNTTEALQRLNAKAALKQHLEDTPEAARPELIQALIATLPSQEALVKNGMASTLDSLEFFWTATRQDEAEQTLYKLYQDETEPSLKKLLDRALMRAKGLYRDALYDFKHDRVGKTVEDKFQRVYDKYPSSQYASAAHFFLGNYYLRAYAVLKKTNKNPVLTEYVEKSNQTWQKLIEQVGTVYTPPIDHLLDAHYFRALNFVLLNQVTAAIAELKLIEDDKSGEQKIYVYQFFYPIILGQKSNTVPATEQKLVEGSDKGLVDKFFEGKPLAAYTRKYLEENQSVAFQKMENLRKFAEYLQLYQEAETPEE